MPLDRSILDNNWLTEAVNEYDLEASARRPYEGYSPFKTESKQPPSKLRSSRSEDSD
jgi:hypothetical protein